MSNNHSITKIKKDNPQNSTAPSPDVAIWLRFVRHVKLSKFFRALTDRREKGKVQYPISSLLLWAFSACAFRTGSKNALQTSLEHLSPKRRQGMCQLLQTQDNKLPHSSTVDHALAKLSLEEVSQIPLQLIKQLEKRKFFYNHLELLPNNSYQIGSDGFWVHTYDHPHAVNERGENICPHCLPRTYHKGTAKEFTQWVHVFVTFVLICKGLTLPLYAYPLKAGDVHSEQRDEKFKQECELIAAYKVLAMIRTEFPKISILFLGDALYANEPMISLCNRLKIDYLIVHKENKLKRLNHHCDELAQTELYQTHHSRTGKQILKKGELTSKASWFNNAAVTEDVYTNVLRYQESLPDKKGYHGAWISSRKITRTNCFSMSQIGRTRWYQEDFHNTHKNRGFEIQHDMARTSPNLLQIWKQITFIAYFLSELFRCTTIARRSRKSRSLKKFFKDLLEQVINIAWNSLKGSSFLCKDRVQFRYKFCDPP